MLQKLSMSQPEQLFIRTYISVLRQQYPDLQTVFHLMRPDNLSVTRFFDAVQVVADLNSMHDAFEQRLRLARNHDKFAVKITFASEPTADQLADMVMLSFFKVVGTVTETHGFSPSDGQGWFSGKPHEWQSFLTNLLKGQAHPQTSVTDDLVTKCIQAVAKLFHNSGALKKKWKLHPPPSWPPQPFPDYDLDDYFDDDEADEPDNPFWQ